MTNENLSPTAAADGRELAITRLIDAPRERLFQAWTDPVLLAQWFAPQPLTTTVRALDARAGGAFSTIMRAPDGTEYPTDGVFLEVTAPARIVFTDAYTAGWEPAPKLFFTAIVTLEAEGDKTRYTARVRHWNKADCDKHAEMGFEAGWNQCLDQLIALVTEPVA